jgi:hypothetical protein
MTLGKVIFGDNQFLGVNHASQRKATELFKHYADADNIIETLAVAYDTGVRDFMFTTHERYEAVFSEISRSNLFPGMGYIPCVPYAHKYWNQLYDNSLPKVLVSTLAKAPIAKLPMALLAGAVGKYSRLIETVVLLENTMCKGLNVKGVFLQNAAFDLLLSLEAYGLLEAFYLAVEQRLGLVAGFITMNHPRALTALTDTIGIERPMLCANFNASGTRMHPQREAVIESFACGRSNNIAMSIFGAGVNAGLSLDFVTAQMKSGGVDSILFGSSNEKNIQANVSKISKFL